ncbi:hypothetical protein PF005_g31053 [Phytophthora fragariae]|uniref:RxLR effector protein n=1 Tax=Phytophthora fragariae TaxID=53985 RepID=A0A6A3PV95_9STRA|nr:hypothetical protein PF003_g35325 [Phytophthora fragariae]KAE8918757.1 hypothetical protein PF009_g30930 [Phytophthora fragariae]KAE8960349.1 hypothetical protein PF011_g30124 [Phytophthora fragariae]KAE9059900.1 hypothetical protein PF010_g30434 [Phytophthora fragariae]KAE9060173.1 hypothetical protein PF007_g30701 [Phytophthora fragariae]
MRLSQVFVVISASFLVTSEAISTTTDSNQVEQLTSLGYQRLLRTHYYKIDEDEANTEERGPLSRDQMMALLKELDIDYNLVKASPMYLQTHAKYQTYFEKANEILDNKGPRRSRRRALSFFPDQASLLLRECFVLS